QSPQRPPEPQQGGESIAVWNNGQQRAPEQPLANRARHHLLDVMPTDVQQAAVSDARWARRLAGPASQTAVEVQLGGTRGLGSFQHLLDEVDAAARTVELVSEQLVGG